MSRISRFSLFHLSSSHHHLSFGDPMVAAGANTVVLYPAVLATYQSEFDGLQCLITVYGFWEV